MLSLLQNKLENAVDSSRQYKLPTFKSTYLFNKESNNVGIIQGEFSRHFETKTIRLNPEKNILKPELLEKKVVMTEFYEGN